MATRSTLDVSVWVKLRWVGGIPLSDDMSTEVLSECIRRVRKLDFFLAKILNKNQKNFKNLKAKIEWEKSPKMQKSKSKIFSSFFCQIYYIFEIKKFKKKFFLFSKNQKSKSKNHQKYENRERKSNIFYTPLNSMHVSRVTRIAGLSHLQVQRCPSGFSVCFSNNFNPK